METRRDIESKAKALINTNPDEAVITYIQLWETFPDQFNIWDAFHAMKAVRASKSPNIEWANEIVEKFQDEKVTNIYGWLIFDQYVKGKSRNEILKNENIISRLILFCPQKNLKENNSFPCPTTISILRLCDANSENLFNAQKINNIISSLDYNLLSHESKMIETKERGDIELSSDLEKYFALKTKALLKIGEFESCIKHCKIGLELLDKFHYNNDLWFKMRIALSEERLGNHEISEGLFQELLASRAGNDKWFLYRDIAEVYFEQEEYSKSWKYAVDASYYGNEPHFLIGLYLLQARILFKLERPTEGEVLAKLIAAILKEQEWNDKAEYNKLFTHFKIDRLNVEPLNLILKEAKAFWQKERYGDKLKLNGSIISIHKNGKIGRIKSTDGIIVGFHKKDLVRKIKSIENLTGSLVEFFVMESYDGKKVAENIAIKESNHTKISTNLVGKTLNGTVKNVTEFGIFIKLENAADGLIHKTNLPSNLQGNFRSEFVQGRNVLVEIEKITAKGISLKLIL